ncbi:MFS general substrate transporter [Lentinus tigrinus ALCF2SS1-7]|uniref:MFS general substrate transporter n=1 Tax=Lentinus tigrinus ALCF2SS1-6 TaxID=1328759 RepID=A0A5C2SWK3_9APHY|nr:MFS general substrate transporter [Lentinus tigrinus ALCF2SS1-6]RPD81308.1 MFS general substrate transporter [Lentinus tigrinus ALCF2SS1-7]
MNDVRSEPQVKPYSIYTTTERWFIVALTGFAAMFSPLTANIYFPAIPTISAVFHKSTELINLTVTVYMIVQGIAPMFWGTMSDRWGRRPMFIGCMVVLCGACVGLALVPTNAYWLLMVLRCLQAAGSASTVALGAGVIADIAAPAERGSFFGIWNIGPMVGPCVGPVLGGVLADQLGWRSIFWFLVISSGVCGLVMVLLLPETLRALVGDGSVPPPKSYRPLIPVIGRAQQEPDYSSRGNRRGFANPLLLFLYPDVTILLLFNALIYAEFYAVTATISTLFQPTYPFLNETQTGLCFLAIGGGMMVGGIVNGELLDSEYQRVKRKAIRKLEQDPESKVKLEDVTKEANFPIEVARLRLMPVMFAIYVAACIGYGWCLDAGVNIAGPLILQIIIGWTCVSMMNSAQTLIIDLAPSHGSAVTACNNLVRCSFGAAAVSVIDLMLKRLGTGWTYVLLSGLCIVFSPSYYILMHYGPRWRAQRRARRQAAEASTA